MAGNLNIGWSGILRNIFETGEHVGVAVSVKQTCFNKFDGDGGVGLQYFRMRRMGQIL